jgi:hypothetical protein
MKILSLLTVVTTIFFVQAHAQKPSGKLVLSEGQQLQMAQQVKISSSLNLMGQDMEMLANASLLHQVQVKNKKPNSYVLNSTITKMKSTISAMGQEQQFDSEKEADYNTETGRMMKDVLNKPSEMEIGTDATVISNSSTTSEGSNQADMLQGLLGGGAENSAGAAEAFLVIPAGSKKGSTWADSIISEGVKLYRNYTLKEIKGNTATVQLNGTQQTNKTVEQMGMDVNVKVDAILSGEALVNINTGIVQQRTLTAEGKGNAEMMGQSIPMTTKVTSTTIVK